MSALAFVVLAGLLVGPVPALLARAHWPLRAPRAAVVLWQAIAVAAALSAFSAGAAIASRLLMPGPDGRPTSTMWASVDRLGWPLWSVHIAVCAFTLLVGVRLLTATAQVAVATRQHRARHRRLLDLVARGGGESGDGREHREGRASAKLPGGGLRILDVAQPLAYCLPGLRSRVVLSEGALSSLSAAEISAVIGHEKAHLRARHDLVLEAFTAAHTAFPRLLRSAGALEAVRLLVELLADDAAVRIAGARSLAHAVVTCAAAGTPAGAVAVGGPSATVRVRRLAGRGYSRRAAVSAYLAAAGVLAVPTVALAIPWLIEIRRLLGG